MSRISVEPRPTSQFQNWCFTAYDLQEPCGTLVRLLESADVGSLGWSLPVVKAQWQLEKCGTTGRIHIQGMVRMEKRLVFATAKCALAQLFGPTVHLEEMRGTWDQNLTYTSKPQTHVSGPFRFNVLDPEAPFARTVEYWFGAPGTGKSTAARSLFKAKGYDIYEIAKSSASKGAWLSGYAGQEGVIMDEVKWNWFDDSNWKKVLDRMPQQMCAGAGGKNVMWTPVHIIMISNEPPTKFMADPAVRSRIHKVKKFNNPSFISDSQMQFEGCSASDFPSPMKK